jgi:hypothetical protein
VFVNLTLKTVRMCRSLRAACRKSKTFAFHVMKVTWRCLTRVQFITTLLMGHILAEIDFSMNHTVVVPGAPQPMHFSPQGVTLLCIVFTRHAMLAVDGFESTLDEPRLVKDHVVVFVNDLKHDAAVRLYTKASMFNVVYVSCKCVRARGGLTCPAVTVSLKERKWYGVFQMKAGYSKGSRALGMEP